MKRLLFFTVLLCSPVLADDLPVVWLEAGKEHEINVSETYEKRWELRYEHRVLSSGAIGPRTIIRTPPMNPGLRIQAVWLIDDVPVRNAIIASPDPFEDRKEWLDKHPIALYDPEKTTADLFEEQEIPFQSLRSFADIETIERAVIVVGQDVDFEREKGLAELLFQKAAKGGSVLIAAPMGDIPLDYPPAIYSLTLSAEAKYLFPLASSRRGVFKWALHTKEGQLVLVSTPHTREHLNHMAGGGPSIVDIRFVDPQGGQPATTQPSGRIIIDKGLRFSNVESRWYFKALIEQLSGE